MPRNDQVTRQRHVLRLLESPPQQTVDSFGWRARSKDWCMVTTATGRDMLTSGVGRMEDILQFAMEPKPVRPVPEVVQVEL